MEILSFSPHALVIPHSVPENILLRSFIESGFKVNVLGCRGALINRCTTQDAHGLMVEGITTDKKKLCKDCIEAQLMYAQINQYSNHLFIDDFIDTKIIHKAKTIYKADLEKKISLEIDSIKIGKIALYETILTFKLLSEKLTDTAEKYYNDLLYGALLIYYSAIKIVKDQNYNSLILSNSQYCHNQVLAKILLKRNCKTYSLHNSLNFAYRNSRIILARENFKKYLAELVNDWNQLENHLNINKFRLNQILEHITISSSGSNVMTYSQPIKKSNPLEIFELKQINKIILVVLSSTDELVAAEMAGYSNKKKLENVFHSQFEWVNWLIIWAKKNQDRYLIIRVHPREMPNRREGITSESVQRYKDLFKNLPTNVKINWPEDNVSIYDFIPRVECILTSWSSVAKEFALIGCPVISYKNNNRSYPNKIHLVANNIYEFEKYLSTNFLKNEFNRNKQMILTASWLNYEQFQSTLNLEFSSHIFEIKNDLLSKIFRRICKSLIFKKRMKIYYFPFNIIIKAKKLLIPFELKNDLMKILRKNLSGPHKLTNNYCDHLPLSEDEIIHYLDDYKMKHLS